MNIYFVTFTVGKDNIVTPEKKGAKVITKVVSEVKVPEEVKVAEAMLDYFKLTDKGYIKCVICMYLVKLQCIQSCSNAAQLCSNVLDYKSKIVVETKY